VLLLSKNWEIDVINMEMFKNKNLVLKWCFRRDRFVSGIRCIHEIYTHLNSGT